MNVELRPGTPEDAETCGRICYEAFGAIASEASPLTAEVVVGLAGDVAFGWGQAGGLS
jgi:hypothetical protein